MSLKGFSIFSSGCHFCSAKWNHYSNFGRGPVEEHNILKSGHWPRKRCHLKIFLFLTLAAILLNGSEPQRPSRISDRHDFSSFNPEVILLLQNKFWLKATKGLQRNVENWFSRWRLWQPCWIFDLLSFSYFVSTRRPNAHHQVSIQLDYRGNVQNMNSQHFSHINV